jgi:hypothetical protein
MNSSNSYNRKNIDVPLNSLHQSNINTNGNKSNEYGTQAREKIQGKNKIMDFLKRIEERKARIYRNSSGPQIETIVITS